MAKVQWIVTGDKNLTKLLNALGAKVAKTLHQKASKVGAQMVLEEAQAHVPVRSGKYRKSLTVRSITRGKRGPGYRVTQREGVTRKDNDRESAFYGGFLEFGWRATGRPRVKERELVLESTTPEFRRREAETKRQLIKTYRKAVFSIAQLRSARKIPGSWVLRNAGKRKEPQAIALYHEVLARLIDEEASK